MKDLLFIISPVLVLFGGIFLSLKLLELLGELMEPKIEVVVRRTLSITLINGDVDSIYKIMRAFQKTKDPDRRLIGFARRLCEQIDNQRRVIKSLDEKDRQIALQELLDQYEESQVLELTDVVTEDEDKDKDDLNLDRDIADLPMENRPPSLPERTHETRDS